MGLSRDKLGEPRVSDVCELGRGVRFLRLEDLGEARELPLCRVRIPGERGLLKEKDSRKGDLGDVGVLNRGGRGAGLGLTKRSGSSTTSSRLGLNGGVIAWMAESSGVVTALPKNVESSSIPGS
jgi:hypothetical protein